MTDKEIKACFKAGQDFAVEYAKAVNITHASKPVSYALYRTWRKWDAEEEPREEADNEQ